VVLLGQVEDRSGMVPLSVDAPYRLHPRAFPYFSEMTSEYFFVDLDKAIYVRGTLRMLDTDIVGGISWSK
jgi:hypothetical protein